MFPNCISESVSGQQTQQTTLRVSTYTVAGVSVNILTGAGVLGFPSSSSSKPSISTSESSSPSLPRPWRIWTEHKQQWHWGRHYWTSPGGVRDTWATEVGVGVQEGKDRKENICVSFSEQGSFSSLLQDQTAVSTHFYLMCSSLNWESPALQHQSSLFN